MKPIIFIPGIEATKLVDANTFDFDTVWNAFDTVGSALSAKVAGPYIEEKLQVEPLYDQTVGALVERNHIARLPYEKSIINLKNKINENKKNPDPVYLFGYDWRLSNVENARRLNVFIQYLQQKLSQNDLESFRFLTHSMGGLIFSCYLTQLNNNFSHIDKVIMCAPPFLGSPYALVHMVKGDGGFKSFLNRVLGRNDDIRKVVRTYPSIFELLPFYDKSVSYTDDNSLLDLTQLKFWQENIYDDIKILFQRRLDDLVKYRREQLMNFSLLPAELRQRMVIVAGTQDRTLTHAKVDKEKSGIKNFVRLDLVNTDECTASGDGTVPEVSSTCFKDVVRTLAVKKENFFDELSNNVDFHGLFLRDSRVQNIITRFFISNSTAAVIDKNNELTKLKGKAANLWFSVGSSVENLSPF